MKEKSIYISDFGTMIFGQNSKESFVLDWVKRIVGTFSRMAHVLFCVAIVNCKKEADGTKQLP